MMKIIYSVNANFRLHQRKTLVDAGQVQAQY